jgi:hypothetical protein
MLSLVLWFYEQRRWEKDIKNYSSEEMDFIRLIYIYLVL